MFSSIFLNLETAVRDAKLAQDLELESLCSGAGHSQRVLDRPTANDSGSRSCANLASPTAVFRLNIALHIGLCKEARNSQIPTLAF